MPDRVPFIAENTRVMVPLAPQQAAAGGTAAAAVFATTTERDDYAQFEQALWPAEIVRLAERFKHSASRPAARRPAST